ncbi:hypothetical protein JCM14076_18970 [Methylosoma difficile]
MTKPRTSKVTAKAKAIFLQALEETCSPGEAAKAIGISRNYAYDIRKADAEFAANWDKAIEIALDSLLDEAYARATKGSNEPIVFNGQIMKDENGGILTIPKKSDRLLEVLLKFRYGDQMSDRLKVKVESTGLSVEGLQNMSPTERASLTSLLSKYQGDENA